MADAIRFGVSISTSGRYALQGRQALAGLQAWAKATKLEGGVRIPQLGGKLPVTLIHYDDAGSPERAVANVERLISVDRVDVLIGPYASDLTRAVGGLAAVRGPGTARLSQELADLVLPKPGQASSWRDDPAPRETSCSSPRHGVRRSRSRRHRRTLDRRLPARGRRPPGTACRR